MRRQLGAWFLLTAVKLKWWLPSLLFFNDGKKPLARRRSLDESGPHGYPDLVSVATGGQVNSLQELLAAGADVNAPDDTGQIATVAAAIRGDPLVMEVPVQHQTQHWLAA